MGHPVYRFGAVVRRLRNDAGLSVLAAAEATGYGKYERWESGQTQVGGHYLATIADVFGVADDLHLRDAPEARVDLGGHELLLIESGRHVAAALLPANDGSHPRRRIGACRPRLVDAGAALSASPHRAPAHVDAFVATGAQQLRHVSALPRARPNAQELSASVSPDARATGRATAARMAASEPISASCCWARVTAV
ncbi:hypothetical protein BH18ACT4_BH18ACT4_02330 [soil metagenome]